MTDFLSQREQKKNTRLRSLGIIMKLSILRMKETNSKYQIKASNHKFSSHRDRNTL